MFNLLSEKIVFGTNMFGFGYPMSNRANPAIYILGYPIYLYALIIVTGMVLAILLTAYFFKKRGYDPYDVCVYALAVIPLGVLGARLYVFIFPWAGQEADWGNFFNFRNGGLGIYGGVILGYITTFVVSKIKKHDFKIVGDAIIPGLLIAQSIGRWGNFANQEAFGPVITNPNLQWFPFGVFIEADGQWHNATFFYESMATLLGFVICLLLLRSKKYKLGWLTAFYGIYYGIARLLIEGLRTDSLFLWIGTVQTDIKISQLVSIFTIILGLYTLSNVYRKDLHALYAKLFKSQRQQLSASRWILLALVVVLVGVSVFAYVKGGESLFILGFVCDVLAVYSILGIFSLQDRLKLYCPICGKRNEPQGGTISQTDKLVLTVFASLLVAILALGGAVVFAVSGITNKVANSIVVAVILLLICGVAIFVAFNTKNKLLKLDANGLSAENIKQAFTPNDGEYTCCDKVVKPRLSKILLFIFPYKQYPDFGISHLKEWVDPDKKPKTPTQD